MELQSYDYDYYEHAEHDSDFLRIIENSQDKKTTKTTAMDVTIKPSSDKKLLDTINKENIRIPTSSNETKKVKAVARLSMPNAQNDKLALLDGVGKGMAPLNANKPTVISSLSIYTVTWNLYGKSATDEDIQALLPEKKYDMYVIGSEECMRSILKSFFFSDKSHWEKMIM
jgi:hypothetical protein